MKAKVFFLICAIGILWASSAMAQSARPPAYDVKQDFESFLGQYTLTEKQQGDVQKAREKMEAAITKAASGKHVKPQTVEIATKNAHEAFRTKVKDDILTADQRKKLKELEAAAIKMHKQMDQPPPQPQPGTLHKKGR